MRARLPSGIIMFGRPATAGVLSALLVTALVAAPAVAYPRPTTLTQVDRHNPSSPAGGHSSISANGRWIAYEKQRDPRSPIQDIFVFDSKTGRTELVSKGLHGSSIIGAEAPFFAGCDVTTVSCNPAISGNGRFVAYMSAGVNITATDKNPFFDVFVYDRRKGETELASVSSKGAQGSLHSYFPSINFNGRYVTFTSDAPNLVQGDTNSRSDIFLRDLKKNKTTRVSVTSKGEETGLTNCLGLPRTGQAEADGIVHQLACGSGFPRSSISYDGKVIAFESTAADVVSDDRNKVWDVFVRDLKKKRTERISVSSNGSEGVTSARWMQFSWGSRLTSPMGGATSVNRAVSADGRFVAFSSVAENLVPNDANGYDDVFVRDRRTDRTTRVSVRSTGGELGLAWDGGISGNGRYVAYTGERQGGDHGGDVYRYDTLTGEFTYNHVKRKPGTLWASAYNFPDLSFDGSVASVMGFFERWNEVPFEGAPHGQVEFDETGSHIFRWSFGPPVGAGRGGSGTKDDPAPDDRICVTPDACIPPGAPLQVADERDDVPTAMEALGADLRSASVTYRPSQEDVFVVAELEEMPRVGLGAAAGAGASLSPNLYGVRFETGARSYELRATSLAGGTFELYDCTSSACAKTADLAGGYGTAGARIVFSIPLSLLGSNAKFTDLEAFTAAGSSALGPVRIFDTIKLR